MPSGRSVTVVLVPVPVLVTLSGLRVRVHVPEDGKPFNTTLPVATSHVGWVIVPTTGAPGMVLTVNEYVSDFAEQGGPSGLSVVTVIVTISPASAAAGV